MKHLKSEFDKLSFREFLAFSIAVCLMLSAIVCIFLSMFIEPKGEIHESVLIYYSISAASASSFLGMAMYFNGKIDSYQSKISEFIQSLNPIIPDETRRPDIRHPQANQVSPAPGVHIERPAGG